MEGHFYPRSCFDIEFLRPEEFYGDNPLAEFQTMGLSKKQMKKLQKNPKLQKKIEMGRQAGKSVEEAIRFWLSRQLPLSDERFLSYKEWVPSGSWEQRHIELDGVWKVNSSTVCLYETKLTSVARMLEGKGLDQLGRAESLILQSPYVSRVLSRLVYVDQNDAAYTRMVANALVAPYDTTPRLGVILVRPEEIEHAASQAGIMLPPDWHSLEARKQLVDVQSVMPRSNTTIAAAFQQAVKQLA